MKGEFKTNDSLHIAKDTFLSLLPFRYEDFVIFNRHLTCLTVWNRVIRIKSPHGKLKHLNLSTPIHENVDLGLNSTGYVLLSVYLPQLHLHG
jgi:hypothetical protein